MRKKKSKEKITISTQTFESKLEYILTDPFNWTISIRDSWMENVNIFITNLIWHKGWHKPVCQIPEPIHVFFQVKAIRLRIELAICDCLYLWRNTQLHQSVVIYSSQVQRRHSPDLRHESTKATYPDHRQDSIISVFGGPCWQQSIHRSKSTW